MSEGFLGLPTRMGSDTNHVLVRPTVTSGAGVLRHRATMPTGILTSGPLIWQTPLWDLDTPIPAGELFMLGSWTDGHTPNEILIIGASIINTYRTTVISSPSTGPGTQTITVDPPIDLTKYDSVRIFPYWQTGAEVGMGYNPTTHQDCYVTYTLTDQDGHTLSQLEVRLSGGAATAIETATWNSMSGSFTLGTISSLTVTTTVSGGTSPYVGNGPGFSLQCWATQAPKVSLQCFEADGTPALDIPFGTTVDNHPISEAPVFNPLWMKSDQNIAKVAFAVTVLTDTIGTVSWLDNHLDLWSFPGLTSQDLI